MKPDVLAPVLAKMQAESAQKLTIKLANRLALPDVKPTTVASNDVPAAAPAPNAAIAAPAASAPITSAPAPSAPPAAPAQGKTGG